MDYLWFTLKILRNISFLNWHYKHNLFHVTKLGIPFGSGSILQKNRTTFLMRHLSGETISKPFSGTLRAEVWLIVTIMITVVPNQVACLGCAVGYSNETGSFSWQNTLFNYQVVGCNDCARQCDSYGRSCSAYECSPTELACAGFQSSSALLRVQREDYLVCKKDFTGEYFEHNSFPFLISESYWQF